MLRSLFAALLLAVGLHMQAVELRPELPIAAPVPGFAPGLFDQAKIAAGRGGFFSIWNAGASVVGMHLDAAGAPVDPEPRFIARGRVFALAPYGDSYVVAAADLDRVALTEVGSGRTREWRFLVSASVHALTVASNGDRVLIMWADSYDDVRAVIVDRDFELVTEQIWISNTSEGRLFASGAGDGFLVAADSQLSLVAPDGELLWRRFYERGIHALAGSAVVSFADGQFFLETVDHSGTSVERAWLGYVQNLALQWTGLQYVIALWNNDDSVVDLRSFDPMLHPRRATRLAPRAPQYFQRIAAKRPVPHTIASHGLTTLLLWRSADGLHSALIDPSEAQPQLVSRGLPARQVVASAWAGNVLGVLWTQRDCEVYFGRLDKDGEPLDGPGIFVGAGSEAKMAANGRAFAVVWNDGNARKARIVDADGRATDTVDLGVVKGSMEREALIASDGDRFLVLWRGQQLVTRVLAEDGQVGPERQEPFYSGRYPYALVGLRGQYAAAIQGMDRLLFLDSEGGSRRWSERAGRTYSEYDHRASALATDGRRILAVHFNSVGLSSSALFDRDGTVVAEGNIRVYDRLVGWDGQSFVMAGLDWTSHELRVSRVTVVDGELREADVAAEPRFYVEVYGGAAAPGRAALVYAVDILDPNSYPAAPAPYVRMLDVTDRKRTVRH